MVHEIAGPRRLGSVAACFDDERLIANAGLLLPATLAGRLGLAQLFAEKVDLGERVGAARPERKAMSLISGMLAGADSIDDCDLLRAGRTEAVLGHQVMAPSTLGAFLRSFSFGYVRQLESVAAELLRRAWAAGGGPGSERLVVDLDSFLGEVHGYRKQGAAYGYTHQRGLGPKDSRNWTPSEQVDQRRLTDWAGLAQRVPTELVTPGAGTVLQVQSRRLRLRSASIRSRGWRSPAGRRCHRRRARRAGRR